MVNTPHSPRGGRHQPTARPRRPWPARHKILTAVLSFIALFVIFAIAGALGSPKSSAPAAGSSPSPKVTRAATASKRVARNALAAAVNACYKRPNASGDIYVRMIVPGLPAQAQQLGGEWAWNHTLNKCQTSVQLTISAAPMTPGNCTQVGYVADNRGYNPNATPARPLKNVVAQAGPACD